MVNIVYGLSVRSAIPLPELPVGEGEADVILRVGKVDVGPSVDDHRGRAFWAGPKEACYVVDDVGAFVVRDGREIIVEPFPGAEEQLVRLVILGPALGLVLMQRGKLLLHASAVAMRGVAVGFLGHNGMGKSTLAAALHARGHEMITDDLAAIDMEEGRPVLLPGFPYAKLWPDAVASLGDDVERLPRLHPDYEKRFLRIQGGFCETALPLGCLYVLATGPELAIEPLNPQDGLEVLMHNWYGARFGEALLDAVGVPSFFLQCAALADAVPVRRLIRPPVLPTQDRMGMLLEDALVQALYRL